MDKTEPQPWTDPTNGKLPTTDGLEDIPRVSIVLSHSFTIFIFLPRFGSSKNTTGLLCSMRLLLSVVRSKHRSIRLFPLKPISGEKRYYLINHNANSPLP